jgi:hypothetical protein
MQAILLLQTLKKYFLIDEVFYLYINAAINISFFVFNTMFINSLLRSEAGIVKTSEQKPCSMESFFK